MSLRYNLKLVSRAKILRKEMTKQERHLWYDFLKTYPVNFQRQKTIGNFIVDFYCHKAKLVIELDGSQHYSEQGKAYDFERDKVLEGFGLLVIRFSNYDIEKRFVEVCNYIDNIVKQRV